jgi:hypothetical protein
MFALLFKVVPVNYGAGWIVDHSDEKWSSDPAIRGAQVKRHFIQIKRIRFFSSQYLFLTLNHVVNQDGAPLLPKKVYPQGWHPEGIASNPSLSREVMNNINNGYFRSRVHVSA